MTVSGYEKNIDKMTPGELRREIGDLWQRIEKKDTEINQLKETVGKIMESAAAEEEIIDMRMKANNVLKDAFEKADSIIKEARGAADKIISHARSTRECIEKGEKEPELVLPGSGSLVISADLLRAGVKTDEKKSGSSFAEYFCDNKTPDEPQSVNEPERTAQTETVVIQETPCRCPGHVFETYVPEHNEVVLPPRAAVQYIQPVVLDKTAEKRCCRADHVFEEYVPADRVIVLPPRKVDAPAAPVPLFEGRASRLYEEYFATAKEENIKDTAEVVSANAGWRELVDSLHK